MPAANSPGLFPTEMAGCVHTVTADCHFPDTPITFSSRQLSSHVPPTTNTPFPSVSQKPHNTDWAIAKGQGLIRLETPPTSEAQQGFVETRKTKDEMKSSPQHQARE